MEWTDKRDLIDDVCADDVNKLAHAIIEIENNKTTEISETSTNEQYPSAKAVYDTINATSNTIEDKITKSISSVMTYKGSITADDIASIYSDTVASVVSELKTGYTFNLTSTWKNNYIPLVCLKIPSGFTVSLSHNQDGYNTYQIYFTPTTAELWKTKTYSKIFNKTTGKLYSCVYYSMGEYDNKYQVVAMVSENEAAPMTTDELYWGEFDNAVVGDNIAWNGTQFDILSGYIDTSDFVTKTQLSDTKAEIENDVNTKLSTVYKYKGNITDSSSYGNNISYIDLLNKIRTDDFPKNGEVYNVATNEDIYVPVYFLDLVISIYNTSLFSMLISSNNGKYTASVTYSGNNDNGEFDVWYQKLSMFPHALLKLAYKKTDITNDYTWYLAYNFNKTNFTCTFDFEAVKHMHDNEYVINTTINPFDVAFGAEKCSNGDNVASKWNGSSDFDVSTYYAFDKLAATVDLSNIPTKDSTIIKSEDLTSDNVGWMYTDDNKSSIKFRYANNKGVTSDIVVNKAEIAEKDKNGKVISATYATKEELKKKQDVIDLTKYEKTINKITTVDGELTDDQYLSAKATKTQLDSKADISKTFYDKKDTSHEWKEGDVAFEYSPGLNAYNLFRYGNGKWDETASDEYGSFLGVSYALRAGRDHKFNIINKTYARKDATYSVKDAAGEGNGVLIKPYTYVSGEEYVQSLCVMTVQSNLGTLNSNTGKYEFTMRSYPAYNILEYPYYQAAFRTDNGITCSEGTGDNWGRIYLSGTATADITFLFWDKCPLTRFKDIKGMGDSEDIDYHLSGIPSGKSASETTYYLSFEALTADNTLIKEYHDTGSGITIPYDELREMAMYRISIKVKSGTTIPSEVIIDPRLALDGYHTGGRYYNNMLTKPSPLQNKVVQCSGMISEYHSVEVITGETDAKDSNGNTITVTPISLKLANDNGIPVFIRLLDKTKVVAVECHYYEAPSFALSTQVKTLSDKIDQCEKIPTWTNYDFAPNSIDISHGDYLSGEIKELNVTISKDKVSPDRHGRLMFISGAEATKLTVSDPQIFWIGTDCENDTFTPQPYTKYDIRTSWFIGTNKYDKNDKSKWINDAVLFAVVSGHRTQPNLLHHTRKQEYKLDIPIFDNQPTISDSTLNSGFVAFPSDYYFVTTWDLSKNSDGQQELITLAGTKTNPIKYTYHSIAYSSSIATAEGGWTIAKGDVVCISGNKKNKLKNNTLVIVKSVTTASGQTTIAFETWTTAYGSTTGTPAPVENVPYCPDFVVESCETTLTINKLKTLGKDEFKLTTLPYCPATAIDQIFTLADRKYSTEGQLKERQAVDFKDLSVEKVAGSDPAVYKCKGMRYASISRFTFSKTYLKPNHKYKIHIYAPESCINNIIPSDARTNETGFSIQYEGSNWYLGYKKCVRNLGFTYAKGNNLLSTTLASTNHQISSSTLKNEKDFALIIDGEILITDSTLTTSFNIDMTTNLRNKTTGNQYSNSRETWSYHSSIEGYDDFSFDWGDVYPYITSGIAGAGMRSFRSGATAYIIEEQL